MYMFVCMWTGIRISSTMRYWHGNWRVIHITLPLLSVILSFKFSKKLACKLVTESLLLRKFCCFRFQLVTVLYCTSILLVILIETLAAYSNLPTQTFILRSLNEALRKVFTLAKFCIIRVRDIVGQCE